MSNEMIAAYSKMKQTVLSNSQTKPDNEPKVLKGLLTRNKTSGKMDNDIDIFQPKSRVEKYFLAINKQRNMLNGKS